MTVSVAIDLALDRLFDYEVPEALKGKLAVGQLLLVPFGRREARGFALRINDGSTEGAGTEREGGRAFKLKSVKSILDEIPFFSERLLALVRHISDYTASPIEVALKAAVPAAVLRPGAREKTEQFVSIGRTGFSSFKSEGGEKDGRTGFSPFKSEDGEKAVSGVNGLKPVLPCAGGEKAVGGVNGLKPVLPCAGGEKDGRTGFSPFTSAGGEKAVGGVNGLKPVLPCEGGEKTVGGVNGLKPVLPCAGGEKDGRTGFSPFYNPTAEIVRHRRNLPHWAQEGVLVFVTFRLADSLPKNQLAAWRLEKEDWLRTHSYPWDEAAEAEYRSLFPERLDAWLNAGNGKCVLGKPEIGKIVEEVLREGDMTDYVLDSYVIMPNHVHVLMRLEKCEKLAEIVMKWKGLSSYRIGRTCEDAKGRFWQSEYYDRLIRNKEHYNYVIEYIKKNAAESGGRAIYGRTGFSPFKSEDGEKDGRTGFSPFTSEDGEKAVGEVNGLKPVLPCAGGEKAVSGVNGLKPVLPKRAMWICEQLERLGGGWMSQVCKELKTTPATLKKMAAEGLVVIENVKRRRDPLATKNILPSKKLALNVSQAAALETIARETRPVLLHGITGSGKTEVYLQAIERELDEGRSSIVLVPEISLTPQTVRRFASRFGDKVALLHSALSDGERYDEWHRIRSAEAKVVVGPRSAVFAPVANLGLIVVDEEHDTSYKQDRSPRYNGRDVAVMRAKLEGAKVVLGSATPSLESWMNVLKGKYAIAKMTKRAGAGTLPRVQIVDMSEGNEAGKIFSSVLIDALRRKLERGEQAILFLNRRGYSRSVTCEKCLEAIMCPKCSVAYTYHSVGNCLRCHVCGGWAPTPSACPACGSKSLSFKGIGTQRALSALEKIFPRAKVLRMDADSTSRRLSHDDILSAFRRGEAQILLGTQMIAKGLDFPRVTLVGVLNADISLNMPDFRASERTYQLLAQVSGRAGRAELPGEVYIQTYKPEELAIRAVVESDFDHFAEEELRVRQDTYLPPYSRLAAVNMASRDPAAVEMWAQALHSAFAAYSSRQPALRTGEAFPSALEKADGWYRWQIVLRAPSTAMIRDAWKWARSANKIPDSVRVAIDIDAFSLV